MKNIGVTFTLRIHSNRWGHRDNYRLTKTEDGWNVSYIKGDIKSDKHASPGLEKALKSEQISFPQNLGYFLSDLWDASEKLDTDEVQKHFDELADWISETERTKPNFGPLFI